MNLPYLTRDLPGTGGRIREHLEDFQVEEVPLYEACGEGTHVYFTVRKAGIPTPAVVERIARYMGVRTGEIGFAGLKDAQAIATQRMSLEHADGDKLLQYRDSQVRVLDVSRHTNKLRPGHLAGNRFVIRIRGVGTEQLPQGREVLDVLIRRGVPNYFGAQRFGARGDTAELGKALIRGDLDEFLAIFLGRAREDDPPDCRQGRDCFDAGFYSRALGCWPRHYSNQRRALAGYKRKKKASAGVRAIDKRMRRLFVSACQSAIFNSVLARRIDSIDKVFTGDIAKKTDTGGIFLVEDPEIEQPRADRFEISPTGPIPGYRSELGEADPGQIERDAIKEHGMQPEDFRKVGSLKLKGTRRPLRFNLRQPELLGGQDPRGQYLELRFVAPSGSYATVALDEIMKVR